MRASLALLSLVALTLIVGISLRQSAASQPIQEPTHKQHIQKQPDVLADGAVNPGAISDRVAYELFFQSILADETNTASIKGADLLAKQTGLEDFRLTNLKKLAKELQQQISVLDVKAREIKDKHWPNPPDSAFVELNLLQAQKEAFIDAAIEKLPTELLSKNSANRLHAHVLSLKAKMKVFKDLPMSAYQNKTK